MALPSCIYFLPMISCFLPKLIEKIVLPLKKFWNLSVSSPGNISIVRSLVSTSPPMWTKILKIVCVKFWALNPLPLLESTWVFPSSIKELNRILVLFWIEWKARWQVGNPISYPLRGRSVLTQSVTSTIPGYVMQCIAIPPKILQGIDKLNRNFLWGNSKTRKKVHFIGWNKITKAKEDGGLGIHVTKPKNTTLLAKLNWRFHIEKSSLWVRVLSNKYRGQRGRSRNLACPPTSSPTWIGFKKGEVTFLNGSKWIAGRNNSLSL